MPNKIIFSIMYLVLPFVLIAQDSKINAIEPNTIENRNTLPAFILMDSVSIVNNQIDSIFRDFTNRINKENFKYVDVSILKNESNTVIALTGYASNEHYFIVKSKYTFYDVYGFFQFEGFTVFLTSNKLDTSEINFYFRKHNKKIRLDRSDYIYTLEMPIIENPYSYYTLDNGQFVLTKSNLVKIH